MAYSLFDKFIEEEKEKYAIRMLTSPWEMSALLEDFGWVNFCRYVPGVWHWEIPITKLATISSKFSIFFDGELIKENDSYPIQVCPGDLLKYNYTIGLPNYLKDTFIPSHTSQQLTLDT